MKIVGFESNNMLRLGIVEDNHVIDLQSMDPTVPDDLGEWLRRHDGDVNRSASSKRAAEIGREQIEKGHQNVMTAALGGDLAPQRAALVLSLVAGFQVMRQMIGLSALADAKPQALAKILGPLFQQLIDGERSSGGAP